MSGTHCALILMWLQTKRLDCFCYVTTIASSLIWFQTHFSQVIIRSHTQRLRHSGKDCRASILASQIINRENIQQSVISIALNSSTQNKVIPLSLDGCLKPLTAYCPCLPPVLQTDRWSMAAWSQGSKSEMSLATAMRIDNQMMLNE